MKRVIALILIYIAVLNNTLFSQTRNDIFNPEVELTWLGIDFTQVNFIGTASQWEDAGKITNNDLRDKYFPGWNELFVDEKAKYDVSKATNRVLVKYATEVTAAANAKSGREYYVDDPGMFRHLQKDDMRALVANYDYKGRKGIGMMFVVEGMNKTVAKTSVWVAFMDMETKKLLFAKEVEAKAGGFGFRNYWGKAFYNVLKEVEKNFNKWK